VRAEIQNVFKVGGGIERIYFPQKGQVPDRAVLTLVVLATDQVAGDHATLKFITGMTMESGSSSRTFKSALIWCVAEDGGALREEARKLLAWKDIANDSHELKLDETQQRQLNENTKRVEREPFPVASMRVLSHMSVKRRTAATIPSFTSDLFP